MTTPIVVEHLLNVDDHSVTCCGMAVSELEDGTSGPRCVVCFDIAVPTGDVVESWSHPPDESSP